MSSASLLPPPPRAQALSRLLERSWQRGWSREPPLEADAIVAAAMRAERIDKRPRSGGWQVRMALLLDDLVQDADLSPLGRTIAYGQCVRLVRARLRAEALFARRPEILSRPVERPVAIVGQMRSGTTRLQRMLACDPGFAVTRLFETIDPVPMRAPAMPRRLRAALEVGVLHAIHPLLARIHPVRASEPEEEFGLHAVSFWGAQFTAQYHAPRLAAHMARAIADDGAEIDEVYAEFAALVRTVADARREQAGARWLWKAPQFMTDLPALARAFPDVSLVLVERDPVAVVGSGVNLVVQQRRVQANRVDPAAAGAQWLGESAARAAARDAAVERLALPVITKDYAAFDADWRAETRRLYRFFGQPLTPATEARMARLLARPARHAGHHYSLEAVGLCPDEVRRLLVGTAA